MLPIVVAIQLAALQKTQHFARIVRFHYRAQSDAQCVGLGHHHAEAARYDTNHVIAFCFSVQDSVIDLLDGPNAVVRVDDLIANFVIHDFRMPP